MAVENVQEFTKNSFEIKLNEVFLGKRRLRYIYLYQPDIVSIELESEVRCIPLFLGCDVLDECTSIGSKNLPRFHAKHAKLGLATKLNFQPGFRIVGIHGTARGVWFYSVQGLFKIAFEYYTREGQQACLCKLQEVWKRQISDPVLDTEIQVKCKGCSMKQETSTTLTSEPAALKEGVEIDRFVDCVNRAIDNYDCEADESLHQEIELLKTYLSYMKQKEKSDSVSNRTLSLVKNCLKLLGTALEKTETLATSYQGETYCENPTSNNCRATQNKPCSAEDRQYSYTDEGIIAEIAHWLGKEFLNYHSLVNERVNLFKQRNMRSIGQLPSAKDLVGEVFPFPMQLFLCSWLDVPLTENESRPDIVDSGNGSNLFPVVQLILELANQSLVSGVAHVLFSQLVQSDCVQ